MATINRSETFVPTLRTMESLRSKRLKQDHRSDSVTGEDGGSGRFKVHDKAVWVRLVPCSPSPWIPTALADVLQRLLGG